MDEPKAPLDEIVANTQILADVIASFDADLLLLQEVHFSDQFNQIDPIKKSGAFQSCATLILDDSHILEQARAQIGIAILAKKPLGPAISYFFSNPNLTTHRDGSLWESHEKGVLSARLRLSAHTEITVGCLHLLPLHKFIKDDSMPAIRAAYIQRVAQQLGHFFAPLSYPLILGGDFNANEIQEDFQEHAAALNLIDVPFKDPTVEIYKFDHILTSPGLEVVDFRVMSEHKYSDHYPCMAEIAIL